MIFQSLESRTGAHCVSDTIEKYGHFFSLSIVTAVEVLVPRECTSDLLVEGKHCLDGHGSKTCCSQMLNIGRGLKIDSQALGSIFY